MTRTSSPSPKQPESPIPDVLAPGLRVLFCGINPGRVSAAAQAHFANPRNDFWRLLHSAGFTPRVLEPSEQFELLTYGIGVTNAAARTTPGSADLRKADFVGAAERLERIADELKPAWIGFDEVPTRRPNTWASYVLLPMVSVRVTRETGAGSSVFLPRSVLEATWQVMPTSERSRSNTTRPS